MVAWTFSCLLAPLGAFAQPKSNVDRVARAIERGDAHRNVGDTLSAVAFYRDAIAVGPRRSEGYAALGSLYLTLGEPARALEVLETGVRNGSRGEALWLSYARALETLGQVRRALDALRHWVELEPGSLGGLRALAEAAERRGAFVEALAARRALLDQLQTSARNPQQTEQQRSEHAHVRALERLLGAAEHVRSAALCKDPSESELARGLARCP
jgi:tetratricopeptide (TPR) repeat protein